MYYVVCLWFSGRSLVYRKYMSNFITYLNWRSSICICRVRGGSFWVVCGCGRRAFFSMCTNFSELNLVRWAWSAKQWVRAWTIHADTILNSENTMELLAFSLCLRILYKCSVILKAFVALIRKQIENNIKQKLYRQNNDNSFQQKKQIKKSIGWLV